MKRIFHPVRKLLKGSPLAAAFRFPIVHVPQHLQGRVPRRLVLHVGVHKTGTTSLQAVMRRRGDQLARQGVVAIARHVPVTFPLRATPGTIGYDRHLHPLLGLMHSEPEDSPRHLEAARKLAKLIESLGQAAPTIVFSTEYLMGTRPRKRAGFYPHAEKQLRTFQKVFPDREVSAILCVRDQDRYLEACYLQDVKVGYKPGTFKKFLARNVDLETLSWLDLADRMASVVGQERLAVRRFETIKEQGFTAFAKDFIDLFADSTQIDVQELQLNPSLSAVGAALALEIRRHVSKERWEEYKALLLKDFTPREGQVRASFFSDQERDALMQRYAGECEAVVRKYPASAAFGAIRFL